jgi:prepilin-type N-terminal cleavage/methylation domain-containing protein
MKRESGFTLLEVMVVLAILGVTLGVSGLAFASLKTPRESERRHDLRRARSEAIETGRPVFTGGNHAPRTTHVLFLPDGRAIGASADPLTGAPRDSTR